MLIVLLRTVLIYVFLIAIMRLMGKRQLGELEVTDLVITLLLSEIATIPLTDKNTPLLYAIVPVTTLAAFEIFSSALSLRFPKLKQMLSPKTAILIRNGSVDRAAMKKVRITLDELMCELRQKDVADVSEVEYAIIEDNGKISVLKKISASPVSPDAQKDNFTEHGLAHPLIISGVISEKGLEMSNRTRSWLQAQLRDARLRPRDIFLMTVDDAGKINIIKKDVDQ